MRAYWGKRRILLANICIATKKGGHSGLSGKGERDLALTETVPPKDSLHKKTSKPWEQSRCPLNRAVEVREASNLTGLPQLLLTEKPAVS